MRRFLTPFLVVALARPASAHDVDITSVARVFLDQIDGRYVFSVVDAKAPRIATLDGVLPSHCAPLESVTERMASPNAFAFECLDQLTFDDELRLPWTLSGVVIVARWRDGTSASAFFRGSGRSVTIRMADLRAGGGSAWRTARRYVSMGVEHILMGVDHLLFILGLLVLVRGFWPLVKTVTAFTIAHSVTLCASVLGFASVDRAAVEAAIALSIVLLAREIVAGGRGQVHLVHRRPWLVAFAFGLLHGFGFAGALGEIGLRAADVPLALMSFNVGVEAGQLAFVAAVVAVHRATRGLFAGHRRVLEPVLGYSLGTAATLWVFERLPDVWM